MPLFERRKHTRLTVFHKALINLSAFSLDHLSVSSRHTRASNKINLCHCQFVLMSSNIHFFLVHYRLNSTHWLFISCSRLSPSMGLCRTRHPPTIADYHDILAVTGGLHPLLDIAPKNQRSTPTSQPAYS